MSKNKYTDKELDSLFSEHGTNNLVCSHRHHWPDHKSCFRGGNFRIRTEVLGKVIKKDLESATRDFEGKLKNNLWYHNDKFKICYLDIETDNLKADFGTMLSWAIKEKDGPVYTDNITRDELFNGLCDKRLVESLIDKLSEYNIVCTYYGKGFDVKFIRTKALHYDIPFPHYKDLYHLDIYYRIRSLLCLSRKSLANVTEYLGIKGKTPLSGEIWNKAKYGDPTALANVLEHNIGDVIILEQLHNRVEEYTAWTRSSI